MINLSSKNIVKIANETTFIKDNVEKVMRLIDILETIFSSEWKNKFVLKGGTAINLFYMNLPRLSVDIDLDYIGKTREETLLDKESFRTFLKGILFQKGYSLSDASKEYFALDSYVFQYINNAGNKDNIKVETNFLDRSHIMPIEKKIISALNYEGDIKISVLNEYELYGSKFAALLGRGKPRDIYDVFRVIDSNMLANKQLLKKCFIFYNCIGGNATILDKDFRIIDEVTLKEFKTMLKPVLAKTEKFDHEKAKISIKNFLDDLLVFSENEKEFIRAFSTKEYKPYLLFDELEYLDISIRIGWHPMAFWRCKIMETSQGNSKMERAITIATKMEKRGIQSLTYISDREVLKKVYGLNEQWKKDFFDLYYGKNVFDDEEKNNEKFLLILSSLCNDKEQILRIFKSSFLYDENKSIDSFKIKF